MKAFLFLIIILTVIFELAEIVESLKKVETEKINAAERIELLKAVTK